MTLTLKGIIPPFLTPFDENGEVDHRRINMLVDFMKPYVQGFFVGGTYGSGALMNVEERKRVFETVSGCVQPHHQLVAHVGTTNLRDTLELARHAVEHKAIAVAAVTPYYYKYDEEALFQFFRALIESVPVPVYLYDNPQTTGNTVSPELVNRLADAGLHGVKDSTFDISKTYMMMRKVKKADFDVVIGSESLLLPAFMMGASASVSGLANVLPELLRRLYNAACSDDHHLAQQLQTDVLKMWDILHYGPSVPTAFAMLHVRSIDAGLPRRPQLPLSRDLYAKVESAMKSNRSLWEI